MGFSDIGFSITDEQYCREAFEHDGAVRHKVGKRAGKKPAVKRKPAAAVVHRKPAAAVVHSKPASCVNPKFMKQDIIIALTWHDF